MMDAQTLVARMMAPLARRLRLMVGRGVVTSIADGGKVQTAQVKLLDGEVRDGVEILQQYGMTSIPPGQREGLYFAVGGDRDHGVMICVADRKFRLREIAPGEAALYDDLGQRVHLTREGIVIDGAGLPVKIFNTPLVTIDAPLVSMTGDLAVAGNIVAQGDISDHGTRSMAGMRGTYNDHTHHENGVGGNTSKPSQAMS
ncbi:phage baseplate assembly protein V [Rhodocyclus gracilis]|nr:phage baseplate assembly protein V [Rhodocyclus gracilis]